MPTFEPPTHEEPIRTTVRPLNYFRLTHANSVVKVAGTFTSVRTPSPSALAGLTEGVDYFLGGRVYPITQSVADSLTAAGYSIRFTGPSGYGQLAYGAGPYGGY